MVNIDKKELVIVAGANGSGKTTFAKKFLSVTKYEFLNADEIAKSLNPKDPTKVRITAGKILIRKIDQIIRQGGSFVIESTLSGSFLEKHIERLRDSGYVINLVFVFLGSEDLCIKRIRSRVLQGGHDVPPGDVKRRFKRGLRNFWNSYRFLADYLTIVFNDEFYDFKRIAHGNSKELAVLNKDLYLKFLTQIKEVSNGN